MLKTFLLMISVLFFYPYLKGQSTFVTGKIENITSDSSHYSITLINTNVAGNYKTVPDAKGAFVFKNIPEGSYQLLIHNGEDNQYHDSLYISGQDTLRIYISIKKKHELAEVTVQTGNRLHRLEEQPQSIAVIDARKYYNRSMSTTDAVNQVAGVRVRQDGGLGSRAVFSINGISGKQVRFFQDGIPMDFYGSGMGINVIPMNTIDHIEIYKGIVPVSLGADALGGAINVVSRKEVCDYLDFSYGISSFSTHSLVLNAKKQLNDGLFFKLSSFYNYSKNNYRIDASVTNEYGNPQPMQVKRFHDKYDNYLGSMEIGFEKKKWADLLSYTIGFTGVGQDVQNNIVMTQPYGQVRYTEHSWNNALKYAKKELLPNLDVDIFLGYNQTHNRFLDTSLNAYNWLGQVDTRRTSGGETGGFLTDEKYKLSKSIERLNATYHIGDNSEINLNVLSSYFKQRSNDTLSDPFPTSLSKNILGLAYSQDWADKKYKSITSVKGYFYRANGHLQGATDHTYTKSGQKKQLTGISQAFSWDISTSLLAKTSYEYAARLPDESEVFGNYSLIRPNPELIPEASHNFNLGVLWHRPGLKVNISSFYRNVDHIIYLKTSQFYSQYQNLLKAQVSGVEGDVVYSPWGFAQLTANITYQDIINKSKSENSGATDNRYYNLRLPNTPYLYANAEIQLNKKNVGKSGNDLQWWYSVNYIHWFYLYWSIDGDASTKAKIPTQYIHNSGLNYSIGNRYGIVFEVHNIYDTKAFDNFSVQRPGRSFHFKIRTFLQ